MTETNELGLFGYQKCRNRVNDNFYTPSDIAYTIVDHLKPKGTILEPCSGMGAFLKWLPPDTEWCEITAGVNFFEYKKKRNWIITNPPFSKITQFLEHSMKIANNIVFLINVPGLFTVKRVRLLFDYDFGIKEIIYFKQPDTWTQTGRQLGAIWLKKHHHGYTKFIYTTNFKQKYRKAKKNVST